MKSILYLRPAAWVTAISVTALIGCGGISPFKIVDDTVPPAAPDVAVNPDFLKADGTVNGQAVLSVSAQSSRAKSPSAPRVYLTPRALDFGSGIGVYCAPSVGCPVSQQILGPNTLPAQSDFAYRLDLRRWVVQDLITGQDVYALSTAQKRDLILIFRGSIVTRSPYTCAAISAPQPYANLITNRGTLTLSGECGVDLYKISSGMNSGLQNYLTKIENDIAQPLPSGTGSVLGQYPFDSVKGLTFTRIEMYAIHGGGKSALQISLKPGPARAVVRDSAGGFCGRQLESWEIDTLRANLESASLSSITPNIINSASDYLALDLTSSSDPDIQVSYPFLFNYDRASGSPAINGTPLQDNLANFLEMKDGDWLCAVPAVTP